MGAATACVAQNHLLLPNKLALPTNKAHVAAGEVILRHSVLLIQLLLGVELLVRSMGVGAHADHFWLQANWVGWATWPQVQLVLLRSRVHAWDLAATVCLSRRWLQRVRVASLRVEACRLFLQQV
jgi:hypothetical protein